MAIRSLLGKFGCCIYAVWGTATSFASPGVSLSLSFTLQSTLRVYRDMLFRWCLRRLCVFVQWWIECPAHAGRLFGKQQPQRGAPSFNWGEEGFPAFLSRWESPTHTLKEKTKWWVVKEKKKEYYYIYLGMTIGPSPGAARWWTVLRLPTQPWPGAIVFSPSQSGERKKLHKNQKKKNKRDERLVKNRPKGWLVGWCATVESCRIRPTFHNNGRLSFYTGTGARTKETTRALMMSPLNNLEQKGGWALAFKTSEFFWFRWTSPRLVYIF